MSRLNNYFLLLLVCLFMIGGLACTAQPQVEETAVAQQVTDLPPTSIPTQTIPPPQIVVKTLAPPPTLTSAPTIAVVATPTRVNDATLPPPPPTAIPTEEATAVVDPTEEIVVAEVVNGCRTREELANVEPAYLLGVTDWVRPAANSAELHGGFGGEQSLIHLGFDVEGTPDHLGELLDVLDARGVKTTMFIMGSWADTNPEWVKEMAARGHEFANHTYSHGNMKLMSAEMVTDELARTEATVQRLTGQSTKPYMRPPFGSRSEESVQVAYEQGWTTVIWSGSTEDWRPDTNEDLMCKTLLNGGRPGAILYSHSWHPDMPAVVDRFIGEMQSKGYTFVPLSVMMSGQAGSYLVKQ